MPDAWSDLYERRRDIQRRFGSIYDLPLVKRVHKELLPLVADAAAVLDVGAGAKRVGQILERERPSATYTSVDPDTRHPHDHAHIADVSGTFDVVTAFEVIEHIDRDDIAAWLAAIAERVKPNGHLVLSTPNVYHPNEYARDATHRTPLCYDQLAGMIEASGLTVTRIARGYADSAVRRVLRRFVFGWLFRLLSLDYARQVVVVSRRDKATS